MSCLRLYFRENKWKEWDSPQANSIFWTKIWSKSFCEQEVLGEFSDVKMEVEPKTRSVWTNTSSWSENRTKQRSHIYLYLVECNYKDSSSHFREPRHLLRWNNNNKINACCLFNPVLVKQASGITDLQPTGQSVSYRWEEKKHLLGFQDWAGCLLDLPNFSQLPPSSSSLPIILNHEE